MRLVGLLALFTMIPAGCGGGNGGGTFACTIGNGAAKICLEIYASTTTSAGIALANTDCTNGGGVASDMCSHAGADGACKKDDSQSGVTAWATTWYYAGQAPSEMQTCASQNGSWISP